LGRAKNWVVPRTYLYTTLPFQSDAGFNFGTFTTILHRWQYCRAKSLFPYLMLSFEWMRRRNRANLVAKVEGEHK